MLGGGELGILCSSFPPHPRFKPGAGSSPLPRRGEGIFTSARPPRASPAVEGGFETRPYVASPSLRERDV